MEYTHKALIAAGYTRIVHKQFPGWVTYSNHQSSPGIVGFAGNDARTNNWIENVSRWKTNFPDVYAWWIDPKQREPYVSPREVIIKGEDPLLVEEEAGA